jgi:hypothetical protein
MTFRKVSGISQTFECVYEVRKRGFGRETPDYRLVICISVIEKSELFVRPLSGLSNRI